MSYLIAKNIKLLCYEKVLSANDSLDENIKYLLKYTKVIIYSPFNF